MVHKVKDSREWIKSTTLLGKDRKKKTSVDQLKPSEEKTRKTAKYLGVETDAKLNFIKHVYTVINQARNDMSKFKPQKQNHSDQDHCANPAISIADKTNKSLLRNDKSIIIQYLRKLI